MPPDHEDFAARYAGLANPELLTVARDYDSLTYLAQAALRAEFSRRHLDPPLIDDLPGASSRSLTTVARYRDLSEAIVARSFLESAGLTVYLYDENLVRLDWQVSNFIGGLRLQVEDKDAPAAIELLTQPPPDAIAFGGPYDFQQPLCPVCGSTDIIFDGASRAAALTGLYLFAIPLPPGRETWHCDACNARWEDTPDPATDPAPNT